MVNKYTGLKVKNMPRHWPLDVFKQYFNLSRPSSERKLQKRITFTAS